MILKIILLVYYFVTLGLFLSHTKDRYGSIAVVDLIVGVIAAWLVGVVVILEIVIKLIDTLADKLRNKYEIFRKKIL